MEGQLQPAGQAQPLPWVDEFVKKYSGGISHTFVLHGAVDDYVCEQPLKPDAYLSQMLAASRLVVFYNCAQGLTFSSHQARHEFCQAIGIDPGRPEEPLAPDPSEALSALDRALNHPQLKGRLAVIVDYPELVWPDGDYGHLSEADRRHLAMLRHWATASDLIAAGQVIILITSTLTDLHASLRAASSMIEAVEIPLPSAAEREAFIAARLQAPDGSERFRLAESLSARQFAALTGGLSRVMVDDICLRAGVEGRPVDSGLIKDRKDQIISQEFGELIEILQPTIGFDAVGGMDEVKDYLRRSVVAPLRGQAPAERMPSGVLLAGPPGTGKTFIVSALAHEAGVNVVKLNAGRLLGQYVGNSERNLEKALSCIRSLVPVIVMIDEIEQQFQRGGSNDGGVERRIFGRILEEMSGSAGARRGEVVWVGATNRVDMVDPALRRPGRFDRIVPILPPDSEGRWEIMRVKLPAGVQVSGDQASEIAGLTDGYTGADLDGVLIKAFEIAQDAGEELGGPHLLGALAALRPSASSEDVQLMTAAALEHCNDLTLIPPAWRERAGA